MAIVTIVEAMPSDPATGAIVPVRLAGGGRRHYRHKGFNDWLAGIVSPPLVSAAIGFDGAFTGGGIAEVGAVGFMPARADARVRIGRLVWTDAPITVSTGDDVSGSPAWTVELAGKVAGYSVQAGLFTFTVANLAGRLADPVAPGTFAGTGGVEGDASAAGRPKRRSWGRVWNVEGRLLDAASNIYEFGDPAHALHAFDTVKDMGRPGELTVVAWAGSIAATLAALKAAPAPQGGGAVAPSIACVKWYTKPVVLTADLRGEVGAGYKETVAEIAAAVSSAVAGPPADVLTTAIAARPHPAGIHVGDGSETGVALLDRLLLRASLAWSVTAAGLLSIEPLTFDNPVATFIAAAPADREAAFGPVTSVSVDWRRNHRIHSGAEISAAVLGGEVAWPDITDPDGTKPQDNADVTGENTAKDTKAVGGRPATAVLALIDEMNNVAIPAINQAVAYAGERITAARARAEAAFPYIDSQIVDVKEQIDAISSSGGYDDTAVKASIESVRKVGTGNSAAITLLADELHTSVTGLDTKYDAAIKATARTAADDTQAVAEQLADLIAQGGGGSEGVDTVARSEIQRVERAYVAGDLALATAQRSLEASTSLASGAINPNQDFRVWPSTDAMPTNYFPWSSPAAIARVPNGIQINNSTQEGGIAAGIETITAGWYVYEAEVYLHASATFLNTGLTMNLLRDDGVSTGQYPSHHFYDDVGHGQTDRWYHFSRLIQVPDLPERRVGRVAFHVMGKWNAFGGPSSTNNTTWRFARIRPASDAEIKAGKADATLIPAISARTKVSEDAIADLPNRYATVQRAAALEAQVNLATDSGLLRTVNARIEERGTAIADAKAGAVAQTVATLRSEYNGTAATVSQQAGTLADVNYRTRAYMRSEVVAGNNRALVNIYADSNLGAGVNIVGDVAIDGNLTVSGTLPLNALNRGQFSRYGQAEWYGNVAPSQGQKVTLIDAPMGAIGDGGSFAWEVYVLFETNAGRTDTQPNYGGSPYPLYTTYRADGGIGVNLMNGGTAVISDANPVTTRGMARLIVYGGGPFNARLLADIFNNTFDSGVVRDGDSYHREVSAFYRVYSVQIKARWTFI